MLEKTRVAVYIDGFNLYFGLRDSGLRRYLWLDLLKLSERLLKDTQTLVKVTYFTSRISGPPDKRQRQLSYLEALGTLDSTKFSLVFGKYQDARRDCHACGRSVGVPSEKMTDVNIAVEMMKDAFRDRFDTAILISADSDLCPAVRTIHDLFPRKSVVVAFPPGRCSKEMKSTARAHFVVGRAKLAASQFPERLKRRDGHVLVMPERWR